MPDPSFPEKSRRRLLLRSTALGLFFLLLAWGGGQQMLDHLYQGRQTDFRERNLAVWKFDFSATERHFSDLAAFIIAELRARPDIASAIAGLLDSPDDPERGIARQKLYDLCLPYYQRLQQNGIRQLHFHSPQSQSLMRMHRPDRFDDSLKGIRPSVELANSLQQPVSGFEEGRIYNGFRYVFPLFHGARHVGSVETSFHPNALIRFMRGVFEEREHLFLIRRDVVESKVFQDLQKHYAPTPYSLEYLVERQNGGQSPRLHDSFPESTQALLVSPLARHLQDMLPTAQISVQIFKAADQWWLLFCQPVPNVSGEPAAAIVALQEAPFLNRLEKDHRRQSWFLAFAAFAFSLIGSVGFFLWQRENLEKQSAARQLDLLARNIPGMLYQYRLDPGSNRSAVPYCSEGIRSLFGLDPAEVAEDVTPIFSAIDPADLESVKESIRQSASSLSPWQCEFRIRPRHRQELFWVEGFATPSALADGSILWHGFLANVTERHKTQQALQSLSDRMETAMRAARIGVWEYDVPTDHLIWDKRMFKLFAVAEENFSGNFQAFADCVHPEDRSAVQSLFNQAIEKDDEFHIEFRILLPDGSIRHLTGDARLQRDESGKLLRMFGINQDVTENRRAREQLMENAREQSILLETIPVQLWYMDDVRTYGNLNQAHADFLGLEPFDIIGHTLDELLPPEVARVCEEGHQRIFDTGETLHVEETAPDSHGDLRTLEITKTPFFNANGKIESIICSAVDVTDRIAAEKALEKQNALLREATRQANAANLAKSAFLATMSHEIRTPLNAIIGMAALLRDSGLNLKQQDYAETIISSGDTLLALINDILDYSKIEAGKLELEEAPFDLAETVIAPLEMVSSSAAEKNLELTYTIDAACPATVFGDASRLKQVLLNLLSNAVKFTASGEVHLALQAESSSTGQWNLAFSVSDTGIGITPEARQKLFQPFNQADSSITRKFGGTGLGLAISRRIVEHMGGTISVDSTPGRGSTFTVCLSLRAAPNEGRIFHLDGEKPFVGKHFLLVDDNPRNLQILQTQLQAWEALTTSQRNPNEVVALLRESPRPRFDAAILDYQMPDLDGLSLAREMRQAGFSAPILLLSSAHVEAPEDPSLITARILKPIKAARLFKLLRDCLQRGPLRKNEKPAPVPTSPTEPVLRTRPLSILIADDNPMNLKVLEAALEMQEHQFVSVTDGRQAVQAVAKQKFDLVLMDVQMPEMDGLSATREIRRQLPQRPPRPLIIALTANAMQGDREACLDAGMDDYLSKPVKPADLEACLARHFPAEAPEPEADQDSGTPSQYEQLPLLDRNFLLPVISRMPPARAASVLKEFADEFQGDLTRGLQALRKAIDAADFHLLENELHRLKGGSGSLGFARLSACAATCLEQLRQSPPIPPAIDLPDIIQNISKLSLQTLDDWQSTLGTKS